MAFRNESAFRSPAARLPLLALGTAAGLAISSTAAADGRFHGVWTGAQVGWAVYDIEISQRTGDERGSDEGLAASGLSAGLFIGTGTVQNGWFLGLQANFQQNNSEFVSRTSEPGFQTRLSVETKESYGLDARIGRILADSVLFYGLVGYQATKVEGELSATGLGTMDDDDTFDGTRVGLGVEYVTDNRVFTRMEYTMTFYGSERLKFSDGVDSLRVRTDPQAQAFHLAMGYRF